MSEAGASAPKDRASLPASGGAKGDQGSAPTKKDMSDPSKVVFLSYASPCFAKVRRAGKTLRLEVFDE